MNKCRTQTFEGNPGSRFSGLLFCVLGSAFCISSLGCNIVGAVMAKATPPPRVKAQFMLPKEPTLILVENYQNPGSLRLESDAIARHVVGEFELRKVATVIPTSKSESLRQEKGTGYRKMPLDAIAIAVGARQVVYVDLQSFEIYHTAGSEQLTGKAEARVRVIDDTGALLWPIDSTNGFPLVVKIDPDPTPTAAGDYAARNRLHAVLADRVAKLFYDWRSDDPDVGGNEF